MDQQKRELSTADLARSAEDMRGRGDEHVTSRDVQDFAEAPRPVDQNPVHTPEPRPDSTPTQADRTGRMMLFADDETERLRTQWSDIQGTFVDSPREAVQHADALVADVMKRMAAVFASERENLERQWDRGDDVTTEDLRVALQRYRGFFDRLLSA